MLENPGISGNVRGRPTCGKLQSWVFGKGTEKTEATIARYCMLLLINKENDVAIFGVRGGLHRILEFYGDDGFMNEGSSTLISEHLFHDDPFIV